MTAPKESLFFDSHPWVDYHPIGKFMCLNTWVDDTVTKSFSKAKRMATKRIKDQIKELQKQLKVLEDTTEETCPVIPNPFW